MSSRLSIAGLMGVVLVAALGMAALRSPSETWAGLLFLLTCGALALGVVGVVCSSAADRPWWLGFALFGSGYLAWAFSPPYLVPGEMRPPTMKLLSALATSAGLTRPRPQNSFSVSDDVYLFSAVGHCLWALLLATLGGTLARVLFPPSALPGTSDRGRSPYGQSPRKRWPRPAVVGMVGLTLIASAAMAASRTALGVWAGATVLLAWGLLGLMALAAVFSRRGQRVRWLGAALFGMGYLALVSGHHDELTWTQYATNRLLDSLRPWLPPVACEKPAATDAVAAANFRVLRALDQTVPMRFPDETPLEEFLKYVVTATRDPDGSEVPIYVDPVGLQEAEKTITSPVSLKLDGVPLRTTLSLALAQLGMKYEVSDGLVIITSMGCHQGYHEPTYNDPFLQTGQSILALVAAGLGGILAPLFLDPSEEPL